MRIFILAICILFINTIYSQGNKSTKEAIKFQKKINKEFSNKEKSPLTEKDLKDFNELDFFPIDTSYIVLAKLKFQKDSITFKMQTNTDRLPIYKIYATASFNLKGREFKLNIYQNVKLIQTADFEDYLFLPYTDRTNGNTTYGGGRYIDLEISDGDTILIDFNQTYNPSCAYNAKYSCPIPPKTNHLDIDINAGVKKYKDH
ncbi:MAG: DUF1684 domain-containing protein [Flavobacteriaceae bacterium]|nr:DUF1684 domain-containing protein [Flavobacteriaceae bacterium]